MSPDLSLGSPTFRVLGLGFRAISYYTYSSMRTLDHKAANPLNPELYPQ